jgi:Fe-S-cluster containining protein
MISSLEKYASLPQVVPQALCLVCDVCCRFPEPTSFLAPYFTGEEIEVGKRLGLSPNWFSDPHGSKIKLAPNGEGCRCPNFDPATHRCAIYELRPLDCRLYPFALYWDEAGKEVLLGMDTKCPFIRDDANQPALRLDAGEVRRFVESNEIVQLLSEHPLLIGPFQQDVILIGPLPRVTEALRALPGFKAAQRRGS